jgi:hypothetical protein
MVEHSEVHKKMKGRNYALLFVLLGAVVLFFGITLVKLKAGI